MTPDTTSCSSRNSDFHSFTYNLVFLAKFRLSLVYIQPRVPREIQTFTCLLFHLFTFLGLLQTVKGEFKVFPFCTSFKFLSCPTSIFCKIVRKVFLSCSTFQVLNLDVVQLNWYKDVVKHSKETVCL